MKKWLKEITIGLVLILVFSLALNYYRTYDKKSFEAMPNIKGELIDGTFFDINNWNGKPIVVHFWGTWCRVCRTEIDNLAKLSQTHNVITIAVSSGTDKNIIDFLESKDINILVYNDNSGQIAQKVGVDVYPTTLMYDSNGALKFSEVGYRTEAGLKARLKLIE